MPVSERRREFPQSRSVEVLLVGDFRSAGQGPYELRRVRVETRNLLLPVMRQSNCCKPTGTQRQRRSERQFATGLRGGPTSDTRPATPRDNHRVQSAEAIYPAYMKG